MRDCENTVYIMTDNGIERLLEVADVAEVAPRRLMIGYLDGEREMIDGHLFGAFGKWKTWLDHPVEGVEEFLASDPLTMPGGYAKFVRLSGCETPLPWETAGRYKRFKRADL